MDFGTRMLVIQFNSLFIYMLFQAQKPLQNKHKEKKET
jgi:hypothetical protein